MKSLLKNTLFALSLCAAAQPVQAHFAYFLLKGKNPALGLCEKKQKSEPLMLTYLDEQNQRTGLEAKAQKLDLSKNRDLAKIYYPEHAAQNAIVLHKQGRLPSKSPFLRPEYPEHLEQNAIALHKQGRLPSRSPFLRPVIQKQAEAPVYINQRIAVLNSCLF